MKTDEPDQKIHGRVREDVIGGNVEDQILKIPKDEFEMILRGWKKIKQNFKEIGATINDTFLVEHPQYKEIFSPSASKDSEPKDVDDFLKRHSKAILRGIDLYMKNITGVYEEENEILPAVGLTHLKRGITREMMLDMETTLVYVFTKFLNLIGKERDSWKKFFDIIFHDYIFRYYPVLVGKSKDSLV